MCLYRCRACLNGGEVQYHVDQYGSPSEGYRFYTKNVGVVRGSCTTWFTTAQMQYFWSSYHHAWVRYIKVLLSSETK